MESGIEKRLILVAFWWIYKALIRLGSRDKYYILYMKIHVHLHFW